MNSATATWTNDTVAFSPEDFPYDDLALDNLKDSYSLAACITQDSPAWCGGCTTVSRCGDWAAEGQCPHCREPLHARFLWADLCRIKPGLPGAAPFGQAVAVYDYE